jgi:cell wall-associated NlpC family hydrolase
LPELSQFGDNAPVQRLKSPFRLLAVALLSAGFAFGAPLAGAQEVTEHSLAASASAAVKTVASTAWQSAQDLSVFALGLIGINYKWGGTTPETGLDCSGLVRYVFQQVTGVTLPRTAKEMSRVGDQVALDDLKPGDLVFFNTRRFAFSHVGIYLGDNRFIHAPSRGREVEVATLDKSFWHKRFNGARRLVGAVPGLVPSLLVSEALAAPLDVDATPVTPATPDTQP